jgi:spermidine synthase
MKVLYLCADNRTVKLKTPSLQSYIEAISPGVKDFENYYIGDDIVDKQENVCIADLRENFPYICNYPEEYFDVIVSEFCPLTLFNTGFLDLINRILQKDGLLIMPKYGELRINKKRYTNDNMIKKIEKFGYQYQGEMKQKEGLFIIFKKLNSPSMKELRKPLLKKLAKTPKRILYLCSNDVTAMNEASNYDRLNKYKFKWENEYIESYFVGNNMKNYGCKASVIDEDFIRKCGLPNKFDAIVSDLCPLVGKNGIFNSGNLFYYMDKILKQGGYFANQVVNDEVQINGKLYNQDQFIDKMDKLGYQHVETYKDYQGRYEIYLNIFIKK